MDNQQNKQLKNVNMPWASALDGALTMSSWLVGPLIAAFLLGSYLDHKNSSGKLYLYICLAAAFLLTIVGLIVQVVKFIAWEKQLPTDEINKKQSN